MVLLFRIWTWPQRRARSKHKFLQRLQRSVLFRDQRLPSGRRAREQRQRRVRLSQKLTAALREWLRNSKRHMECQSPTWLLELLRHLVSWSSTRTSHTSSQSPSSWEKLESHGMLLISATTLSSQWVHDLSFGGTHHFPRDSEWIVAFPSPIELSLSLFLAMWHPHIVRDGRVLPVLLFPLAAFWDKAIDCEHK